MGLYLKVLFSVFLITPAYAQKAYDLDSDGESSLPAKESSSSSSKKIRMPPAAEQTSIESAGSYDEFESAIKMRTKRRVGVGFLTSGQLGLIGLVTELNYNPYHSAVIGFGGGPRYNSLTLQYKYLFGGRVMSPYMTMGYSRWYNSSSQKKPVGKSFPSVLTDKFLTEEEKETGVFGKDFLVPSLGIQYSQLYGKSVGTSIYAELVFLVSAFDFQVTPTGALGMLYYF